MTVFLTESTAHKPFHNPVLTKFNHELMVFVTVLNHFLRVLPVVVRILPDDEDVEVDEVPVLAGVLLVEVVEPADPAVLDDVDAVDVVVVGVVPVEVDPVPEEVLPELLVLGELTMLFSCCQKPDPNEDIQPGSAKPDSSGSTIFISGRFARLATISSICL